MVDWRNPDDYAYTADHDDRRWAWEFLRRNPEYRAFWERLLAERHAVNGEFIAGGGQPGSIFRGNPDGKPYPVDDPAFCLPVWPPSAATERWGLYYLLNPGNACPPVLTWASQNMRAFAFDQGRELGFTNPSARQRVQDAALADGEVAVVFNYRLPLAPQIEQAKAMLAWSFQENWKRRTGGAVPSAKPNRGNFPLYLRVWDAKQAGASYRRMDELIAPPFNTCRELYRLAKPYIKGDKYKTLLTLGGG